MQSTLPTTSGAVTIASPIPPSQLQDTPPQPPPALQAPLGSSSSSMDHLNQIFDAVRQQIHNWGERAKWKIDLVLLENDEAALTSIAATANAGSSAHAFSSPDTTLLPTSKQLVPIAPMVPPGAVSTTPQLLPHISGPVPSAPQQQPQPQSQVSLPSPAHMIPPVVPMLQGVPILSAGAPSGAPPLRESLVRIRALESLVKSQSEQVKAASVRVDKTNFQIDTMRNIFLQREQDASLRYSVETRLLQQDIKALTKKLKDAQAKLETESEWSDGPSSRKLKEAEARYAVETSRFLKERKALKRKLRHSESRSAQKESELEYAQQQLYFMQHGGNPPPPPSQHDQTGPLGYTECNSRFASSSHQGYEPPQLQRQPRSGLDNLVLLADQMLSNPSSNFLLPPADIPDGSLAPHTVTKLALDHPSPTPSPIGGGQTAKSPPSSSVNSTHEDTMSVIDAEGKDVDMVQCDHVGRGSGGRDDNVHPSIPGFTSQSSNIVEREGVQDDFAFKVMSSSPTTRGSIVSSDPSSRTPSPTQAAAAVMAMDLGRSDLGRSDLGRSKRSIDSAAALLLMPNMVFPRAPPAVEEERDAEEAAVRNTRREMEEEEQGPLSALAIAASLAPMQQTPEKVTQPQQRQGTQVLQHPHLLPPQRERSPALQAIAPRPSTPSSSVTLSIPPQPSSIPIPAGRSHTPPPTPPATARKKPRSPYSKWTPEQDAALRSAIEKHGAKNWEVIAQDVPGRTYHQCRQRWIKVLKGGSVRADSENSESSPEDNGVDTPREKTPNPRTEQALAALQARYAESSSSASSATTSSATLLPSLPSTPSGRQLGIVGTRSTSSTATVTPVPQTPHQQTFPMYQQITPNTSDALRGPIIFPNVLSTPTPLKHDGAAAQPYASVMSTPPPRAPNFNGPVSHETSGMPTQPSAPKKRKTRGLSFGDGYPRGEPSGGAPAGGAAAQGDHQHGVVAGLRKKKRGEEKETGGFGAPASGARDDGELGAR
ncbi:hypothetical protein BC937DRAFT_92994 [Endogone sp. FLAS-F59071]|nr:hypothetical protein BC937DRAFT_92994 [Endogone sp. FLAS-F59071]|eukprot:RUS15026.1 hypothetical protein BC937DRAFT_92994 [Endogone sp. FLAS-F59071]